MFGIHLFGQSSLGQIVAGCNLGSFGIGFIQPPSHAFLLSCLLLNNLGPDAVRAHCGHCELMFFSLGNFVLLREKHADAGCAEYGQRVPGHIRSSAHFAFQRVAGRMLEALQLSGAWAVAAQQAFARKR